MNRFSICFFIVALFLSACETDPQLMNPDADPTMFVFACLDLNSGKHQVRVRQAIQEEGDVRVSAQNPELILPLEPIRVSLIIRNNQSSDTLYFDPLVYPKEEGVFSSEQNIIHELEFQIKSGYEISLSVEGLISGYKCTARAPYMKPPVFTYPRNWYQWTVQEYRFTNIDEPFHVSITSMGPVCKLLTEIKYLDVLKNGDTIYQKAVFAGNPYFPFSGTYNKVFELSYLFNIFNAVIPDDPEVKYRKFYRFHFKAWKGSGALAEYLHFGQRHTDNRKLYFSNINGGYGLFYSCCYGEINDIAPLWYFTDTLNSSPATSHLKFIKWRHDGEYIDPDTANIQPIN
jgi:hypothetical protein